MAYERDHLGVDYESIHAECYARYAASHALFANYDVADFACVRACVCVPPGVRVLRSVGRTVGRLVGRLVAMSLISLSATRGARWFASPAACRLPRASIATAPFPREADGL